MLLVTWLLCLIDLAMDPVTRADPEAAAPDPGPEPALDADAELAGEFAGADDVGAIPQVSQYPLSMVPPQPGWVQRPVALAGLIGAPPVDWCWPSWPTPYNRLLPFGTW